MIFLSTGNKNYNELIKQITPYKNVEIRLDLCHLNENQVKELFAMDIDFIVTFRGNLDSHKFNFYKIAIESGAKYCDIDFKENQKIRENIKNICKLNNCKLIYSYHNFEDTPSLPILKKIIEKIEEEEANLIKIVCTANNLEDTLNIMELYKYYDNLIAFSMGELGKFTRIFSSINGAKISYAALDNSIKNKTEKTAPGQLEFNKLSTILELLNG